MKFLFAFLSYKLSTSVVFSQVQCLNSGPLYFLNITESKASHCPQHYSEAQYSINEISGFQKLNSLFCPIFNHCKSNCTPLEVCLTVWLRTTFLGVAKLKYYFYICNIYIKIQLLNININLHLFISLKKYNS